MGCVTSKTQLAAVDNNVHLEHHSFADSDDRLSTLLEQEPFLRKVLCYVADDGLHECRRVCRFWQEVCSTFLVKIREIRPSEVPAVLRAFPRVTSLRVGLLYPNDRLELRNAMPLLTQLQSLQHLHLSLQKIWAVPAEIQPCLKVMNRLRHLSLGIIGDNAYLSAIDAIRHLKQIESLSLDVRHCIRVNPHPVTELRGIRFLSAPCRVIVNSDGELLFPLLTQMTGFKCNDSFPNDRYGFAELKAIRLYTPTLQSLEIDNPWSFLCHQTDLTGRHFQT